MLRNLGLTGLLGSCCLRASLRFQSMEAAVHASVLTHAPSVWAGKTLGTGCWIGWVYRVSLSEVSPHGSSGLPDS